MHSLPLGYRINGERIINLFYWFACPRACHYPESKAFLSIQEGKDEEEWREMKRNNWKHVVYAEEKGMNMEMIRSFLLEMYFVEGFSFECCFF